MSDESASSTDKILSEITDPQAWERLKASKL
jgi:hypothetical protein